MPFLPRKNSVGLFGGGKPDDDKEEDAGILAYVKDDDAVSADFHCRKACVSLLNEGRWNTNIPLKPRCFLWGQCILHPENSNSHLLCRFAGGSAKMQM